MELSVGLIGKGLLGIVAIGATTTVCLYGGGVFNKLKGEKTDNQKIKELGISGCELGLEGSPNSCTLSSENLKGIKFVDKNGNPINVAEGVSATLKIEKVVGEEAKDFPGDLKFTITNTKSDNNDLIIGESSSENKITLKKDIGNDFKIRNNNKKDMALERAWDLEKLGEKVGLKCGNGENAECSIGEKGINVWKDNDYSTGAKKSNGDGKIIVTKDSTGYKEGFKFTVDKDIALKEGTPKTGGSGVTKLTKDKTSYGIELKDLGENKGKK